MNPQFRHPKSEDGQSRELEIRVESKIGGEVSVATPAFLPVVAGFRVAAEKRTERFVKQVQDELAWTQEQLEAEISAGGARADVFAIGMTRSQGYGNDAYRTSFARMVANALRDDSRVDAASYVMARMEGFTPLHIRAFWSVCLVVGDENKTRTEKDLLRRLPDAMKTDRQTALVLADILRELRGWRFLDSSVMAERFRLSEMGLLAKHVIGEIDSDLLQ